ncbi:MAG: aminoacetone oxidase family FAD-binding enzyme [Clostridiales bacterium]|nr:aminoacetone oxidase family FAD-binding enzyme [Clostridiales bacterium]
MKIGIIGGGASGLAAAIAAKTEQNEVIIFERENRVGKKILATGNGRCNLSNAGASDKNYHGSDPTFVNGAVRRYWVQQTLDFFSTLGILCKEEENGKIYPYSDTASAVLDVLRRRTAELGVKTICGFDVKCAEKTQVGFEVESYGGEKDVCDRLVIAAGGKASPNLGSNGSGFELLKGFGHRITKLSPSLVQLRTETEVVKKLKGIKVNAGLTLGGNFAEGELLFTDYGLSGPPVFTLSAYLGNEKEIYADIMPEYTYDDIVSMLYERCAYLYNVSLEEFFTGMLNKRVGQALMKFVGISPLSRPASTLCEGEIKKLASTIKAWKFNITGTMSWNNAQVTHGGAVTSEFNSVTMESKLVKGLYACGEVLDIDGDCGGYNLQWAWSSGHLAGIYSAKENKK